MKIKIGLSISLGGSYSPQGIESFQGIKLWTEHVNSKGGLFVDGQSPRVLIELIHYDDSSSVEQCISNIERLITKDRVDILLGPYSSSLTLAACELAQKHNITLWNHGGSTDEIEERGFENVINAITPASQYSHGILDCIRAVDSEARKIATFSAQDSGFSSRVASGTQLYGKKLGFDVREYKFISGTHDFTQHLEDLISYNPDLILGIGRAEDDLALAKFIVKEGVSSKALAYIVASIKLFKDELGDAAEGAISASQWEKGIHITPEIGPTPMEFFSNYKSEYNKAPDYVAAQAYNMGLILEKCIQLTGNLDDIALREAARNAELDTFYGKFKTDSNGNQIGHEMVVVQWQKGQKAIVHPETISEAKLVYPL